VVLAPRRGAAKVAGTMAVVPSAVLVVGGIGTLVASGPFALLFLPVFLPPIVFFGFYGRAGIRLIRGDAEARIALVSTVSEFCPVMANRTARRWPRVVPGGGR